VSVPATPLPPVEGAPVPLCVDLDGTLLKSNLLVETLVGAVKQRPLTVFALPLWLARGRAALKRELASRCYVDVTLLPYDEKVLADLRRERLAGRQIFLATAADETLARRIATHLTLFDGVVASDGQHNLKGEAKARALAERFGDKGFDYIGNDHHDIPVWERSRVPIKVEPRTQGPSELLRAMRVHQWAKNLLLLVPLLTAHRLLDGYSVAAAVLGFAAFSLVASAVYVANDLADLDEDRRHPSKRRRAIAAGDLPIETALVLIPILLAAAAVITLVLPRQFGLVLLAYVAANLAYSLFLKRAALVDVFVLAGLYTLRILAGAAAIEVPVSHWLLAFSMFAFLSLAFAKRFVEVANVAARAEPGVAGRGYLAGDGQVLGMLGTASGYLSVLVFALYITSRDVMALYRTPAALWLGVPLLLYWISRMWLLAHRGAMYEDPVLFAVHDWPSYATGAALLLVMFAAT
jgi:4-hydroxybenzoate polyprenyltransferase